MDESTPLDGPHGEEQQRRQVGPRRSSRRTARSPASTSPARPSRRQAPPRRHPHQGRRRRRSRRARRITVNYLGQVYNGKKPFDESYSGEPASFADRRRPGRRRAGTRRWSARTVGSRVILAIPPADGYGKEGNEHAGIKGTDTLYFVVDILALQS